MAIFLLHKKNFWPKIGKVHYKNGLKVLHLYLQLAEQNTPVTRMGIRMYVKSILDREDVQVKRFVDNMPGKGWVRSFLERNKLQDCVVNNGGRINRKKLVEEDEEVQ